MRIVLMLVCIINFYFLHAQSTEIKGEIKAIDTTNLNIIKISPDSFPQVSVVFEALKGGLPIFELSKEVLQVTENGVSCKIKNLEVISENYPISISLVIDHSGSMGLDYVQLFDTLSNDWVKGLEFDKTGLVIIKYPNGYTSPLENAKTAVNNFVENFVSTKDSIQIIGFSNTIDEVSEFSNNKKYLDSITNKMTPTLSTAFIDALDMALKELNNRKGIKIVVALTDGMDNASIKTSKQVIEEAQRLQIPIFNIGLGDVDKLFLKEISDQTKGAFYYTKKSNSLINIYQDIQKRIKSIYDLKYESVNLSSNDTIRKIRIEFDVDSTYVINNIGDLHLAKETITYLLAKERRRKQKTTGLVVIGIAVSAGVLIYRFRRRRKPKQNAMDAK